MVLVEAYFCYKSVSFDFLDRDNIHFQDIINTLIKSTINSDFWHGITRAVMAGYKKLKILSKCNYLWEKWKKIPLIASRSTCSSLHVLFAKSIISVKLSRNNSTCLALVARELIELLTSGKRSSEKEEFRSRCDIIPWQNINRTNFKKGLFNK